MLAVDPVAERIALAFLELWTEDRAAGRQRGVEEYVALFPAHAARIRAEHAQLVEGEAVDASAEGPERRIGRFRLVRELGRGGQGVVWLAEDERYHRTVALKVLPALFGGEAGGLPARVAREVEAISRLDHPGICVAYEAGEADGHAFVAMRYVPGDSLARMIRDNAARAEPLTNAELDVRLALIEKAARALHAAHSAGIVHRDVKPANVIVHAETGDPVLLDFGLARSDSSAVPTLTRSGDLIGTPHYMAPERLRGAGNEDARADVWSLGVTLYELVTGRRPFDAPTVEGVVRRIEADEPADPRVAARLVSRDLAVVMATALEKSLSRRYADARELAGDLARVRRGEPVLARPISIAGRAGRWVRRNPWPAGALGVLATLAVVAALVAVRFERLGQREREARADAQGHLARSAYEEARLWAFADEPGRRLRALQSLEQARVARAFAAEADLDLAELPTPVELRTEALAALLRPDAKRVRTISVEGTTYGSLSGDGRRLALQEWTSAGDGAGIIALHVIDTDTGETRAVLDDRELVAGDPAIALSPDAARIALLRPGGREVALIDVEARRVERTFALPEDLHPTFEEGKPRRDRRVWSLAFSPDGRHLAGVVVASVNGPGRLGPHGRVVWEVKTGRVVFGGTTEEPIRIAWSTFARRSGDLVLPGGGKVIHRLQLAREPMVPERLELPAMPVRGAVDSGADPLALFVYKEFRDGSDLLGAYAWSDKRTIYNATVGFLTDGLSPMVFSHDERYVAFGDEAYGLHLVRAADGQTALSIPRAHGFAPDALAFDPDGKRLVSHAAFGDAHVWDLTFADGLVAQLPVSDGQYNGLWAVAPDGAALAYAPPSGAADGPEVQLLRNGDSTPDARFSLEGHTGSVRFFEFGGELGSDIDGRPGLWLGSDALVSRWDLATGERDDWRAEPGERVERIAFTVDGGARITLRTADGFAWVDPETDRRRTPALRGDARNVPAHTDARYQVVLTEDVEAVERLATWVDLEEERGVPLAWEAGPVGSDLLAAAASADGRHAAGWLVAAARSELLVWSLPDGEVIARFPFGQRPLGNPHVAFLDGEHLVFTAPDHRVGVVALQAGELVLSWQAHEHPISGLAVLDRGVIATREEVGAVRLWDVAAIRRELAQRGLDW